MTDEQLQAIKARRAAVDPVAVSEAAEYYGKCSDADWTFAQHAPADIDTLLAEVERLQAECDAWRNSCTAGDEEYSDLCIDRV